MPQAIFQCRQFMTGLSLDQPQTDRTDAVDARHFGRVQPNGEWHIRLTVPKVEWQVAREMEPKTSGPKLETEVDRQTLLLRMSAWTSAIGPASVMDRTGDVLNREEILVKLRRETPVLVSLTGKVPDPYYLQLTYPEALIVILGDREKAPRADLLPAKKITASKN